MALSLAVSSSTYFWTSARMQSKAPATEPSPYVTAIELLDELPQICRVESLGERHQHPGTAFDDVLLFAKRHRVVIHILDRLVRGDEIHHFVLLRPGAVPETHKRHTAFDIE